MQKTTIAILAGILVLAASAGLATAGNIGSTTTVINTAPTATTNITPDDSALAGTQVTLPPSGPKIVNASVNASDANGWSDINQSQGNCSWFNSTGIFNWTRLEWQYCTPPITCHAWCAMDLYPDNATGDYGVNVTVNDSLGNASTTTFYFNVPNGFPQYTAYQVNNSMPLRGSALKFISFWQDYSGLAGWVFESNFSGAYVNESVIEFTGTSNTTSTELVAPTDLGTYGWRIYANNTAGNFNATPEQAITVVASATPQPTPVPTATPTATSQPPAGGGSPGLPGPIGSPAPTATPLTSASPTPQPELLPFLSLPPDAYDVTKSSDEKTSVATYDSRGRPAAMISKTVEVFRYRRTQAAGVFYAIRTTLTVRNVGTAATSPFELTDTVPPANAPLLPTAEFYRPPERLDGAATLVWRVPPLDAEQEITYAYQVFTQRPEQPAVTVPKVEQIKVDQLASQRKESEIRKLLLLFIMALIAVLIGIMSIHSASESRAAGTRSGSARHKA